MHAAAARYVSVSELYSTDEVELLLDEIRDLEPTSCRGEDIQDFEIAGSGAGLGAASGGRSPAGTERSWDSHAHYSRPPPPPPRPIAPVYCHLRHLLTPTGALTLLIVLCSTGACGCVWAGVGLRAGALPLAGRVQLLLLAAATSAPLHAALLLLRVTRLAALLPPAPARAAALLAALWSGAALSAGALASLAALLLAPEYRYTPPPLAALLLAAAGLGLGGACAALCIVGGALRACMAEHSRAALAAGGGAGGAGTGGGSAAGSSSSLRTAYRAVPTAPQPSTSRQNAL